MFAFVGKLQRGGPSHRPAASADAEKCQGEFPPCCACRTAASRRPSACGSAMLTRSLRVGGPRAACMPPPCIRVPCLQGPGTVPAATASVKALRQATARAPSARCRCRTAPPFPRCHAQCARAVETCASTAPACRPRGVPDLLQHHPAHKRPAAAPGVGAAAACTQRCLPALPPACPLPLPSRPAAWAAGVTLAGCQGPLW